MMKRCESAVVFFLSFLALISSQAQQSSSSRRRPAGVSSTCCELIEPLTDWLNVCHAGALKVKLIYALAKKIDTYASWCNFLLQLLQSKVLDMQSGVLSAATRWFLNWKSLLPAFRAALCLWLFLTSSKVSCCCVCFALFHSPFFSRLFLISKSKVLGESFLFLLLAKSFHSKERSHCRKQLKASGADGDSLNPSVFVIWFYVMSLNELFCLNAFWRYVKWGESTFKSPWIIVLTSKLTLTLNTLCLHSVLLWEWLNVWGDLCLSKIICTKRFWLSWSYFFNLKS